MKNHKTLLLISFIGMGILGLTFVYNIIFALATNRAPAITVNIAIFFLPMLIALFLVPYGLKKESRQLIYVGNMLGVVSAGLLSYQLARLCFTTTPGLIILLTTVWSLILLAGSLTMMAYSKKADFTPIHIILTIVALVGVAASVITNLTFSLVNSIRISSGIPFGNYVSIGLAFLAIAPIVFFTFTLKDEARLVKLEVPEWVKPVKAAPAPKAEPKVDNKNDELKVAVASEPAENKEETPKA